MFFSMYIFSNLSNDFV